MARAKGESAASRLHRARQRLPRDPSPRRVLRLGALVLGCLLVGVFSVVAWSFRRAEEQLTQIGRLSDESTFLIGDLGRQLAREQAALTQAAESSPALAALHGARAARAADRRERVLRALPSLLTPLEQERWRLLEADAAALGAALGEVATALRDDDGASALERLDAAVPLMLEVQAQVDGFGEFHQAENARRRLAAQQRARASLRLSVLLAGTILVLGVLVWGYLWRLSRARAEANEMLERVLSSNVDLDAYARRIAHDLRNLLGPPLLMAGALERGAIEPERVRQTASQLRRTLAAAADMIDGLLELSRGEADLGGPHHTPARKVIEAVIADREPSCASTGLLLRAKFDESEIVLSEGLLRMIVENLIDNAVKFTRHRGDGEVRVCGHEEEGRFLLTVSDTGAGIPAHALPHIFEAGFRETGALPGKGLGLSTVKRIVDDVGGEIEVRSTPGVGTEMRVWLPLAEPSPPAPSPKPPDPTGPLAQSQ